MEVSVLCDHIAGYDITTDICKCYDSLVVVACAKFVVISSLEFGCEQNKIPSNFKKAVS